MKLIKKQIEKLGAAYLAEQLYREGLKFAYPDIDDGIDLLVYDWSESVPFRSVPVQMKSFSDEEFLTDQKYSRINGLFIVYLWYVGTGHPIQAFGMKYPEAERIVDRQNWSRNKGRYAITRGTEPLRQAIHPFKVESWKKLFFD